MEILLHTLDNGIRLVHHRISGMVAHCGLIINAGSRDESDQEHGMAHFIEHMLFKGTKKRKAFHILSRLEDTGGELNAYTTKEETAVHASFLVNDYERAIELISDIVLNSVFPEKEIEKEKEVVIDEINSYLDNPAELIFDDFEELIFPGQQIGRGILGAEDTIRDFSRSSITRFTDRHYAANQMVFCSVGDISDQKIIKLFTTYFNSNGLLSIPERTNKKWNYQRSDLTRAKDTYQSHCIIGTEAYDLKDKKRLGMFMLNNILGGQGMNSRLNLSLREKYGLAYNIESAYNPYSDTGVFLIYFGTEKQQLEKSIGITMAELKKLREIRLGSIQMSRARNQIKGYIARGYENHENLMLSIGKSLQVFGKIDTFEELCRKIEGITPSQLLETANEIFDPSKLSTLIYK
jgi:predicted Zn-dependent peptidase